MAKIVVLANLVLALVFGAYFVAAGDDVDFLGFSAPDLDRWSSREFSGATDYELAEDPECGGKLVLSAVSNGTASARHLSIDIDILSMPVLFWRWRVDSSLAVLDERTKAGDDFAARIYVVSEGIGIFKRPLSISYVWGNATVGESWFSPFSRRQKNVVVASGMGGKWRMHERNVREDFLRFHGTDVSKLQGIALMTDTDNSEQIGRAWYDYIEFGQGRSESLQGGSACPEIAESGM